MLRQNLKLELSWINLKKKLKCYVVVLLFDDKLIIKDIK